MAKAEGEGASRAVDRVLSLLDLLSRADAPLGTREMARSLGFPLSATHRVLAALERHQYVRQEEGSGKYTLGTRILELSSRLLDKLDVRQAALPVMRQIRDSCDETVSLYVVEGLERVCIERLESRQRVRSVIGVGSRLPLHVGASSKVLLAYLPPEQRESVLQGCLERYTEHTIADPEELRRHLEQVRSQGYARSVSEHIPDAATLAAPIWGHGERGVVAAMAIPVPLMRFTRERERLLLNLLLEGTARISRTLGAQVGAP